MNLDLTIPQLDALMSAIEHYRKYLQRGIDRAIHEAERYKAEMECLGPVYEAVATEFAILSQEKK